MIKLGKENILNLHRLLVQETGGGDGIRDCGLLESAAEGAFLTFDGSDLFPTLEEKAAKLGFSLISNHAFVDGNKRIGMLAMLTFLDVNGIKINATDGEVEALAMKTASGQYKYGDILNWILLHEKASN